MQDPSESTNRASAIFRSTSELRDGIAAAVTLGMRDLTVTTVRHKASTSTGGDRIPETVEYHFDAAMLDADDYTGRQLAHVADVRHTLEHGRAS